MFLLLNTVINLAYVPILIHYIGIDQFGLYKLLGSFIAYFGVLDFGLSATIVRFLVKYKVNGEVENINKLLSVAGLLYTGIGVIITSIGVYFYFLFPTLFPKLSTDFYCCCYHLLSVCFNSCDSANVNKCGSGYCEVYVC